MPAADAGLLQKQRMPVSEQVAERLTDLAYAYWLPQLQEREEAAEQKGIDIHKLTPEQKQREFTAYLRAVKRIPHQGYSTFDDASPDPGCHWEVDKRQLGYYPAKFKDATLNKVRSSSTPAEAAACCLSLHSSFTRAAAAAAIAAVASDNNQWRSEQP